MKRVKCAKAVLVLLLAGCLLVLCGCGGQQSVSGCYMVDYELPYRNIEGLTFAPFINVHTGEDAYATLGYGPGKLLSGFYTIEEEMLVLEGWSTGITVYFEIIDSKTLKLVDASKPPEAYLSGGLVTGSIKFGDVFYWTEPLPEEAANDESK